MITKEHILQAKQDTIQIFDDLLANFEPVEPISNIQASLSGNVITVEWESNSNSLIDIEYYADGQREWKHSVADYVGFVHSDEESYDITVGAHSGWKVRIKSGDWTSEAVNVKHTDSDTEPPIQDRDILWGIWGEGNGFSYHTSIDSALEAKFPVMSFTHRWKEGGKKKSRDEWKRMIGWMSEQVDKLDPTQSLIMIQDEPLSNHHARNNGYTVDDMSFLYREFKNKCPDHQFGFSHTEGEMNRGDIPDSDWVMLTAYYFHYKDYPATYITNEQEFDTYIKRRVEIARNYSDNIYLIGQGFYNPADSNRKIWRKAPDDCPHWYYNAMQKYDIKGILWWVNESQRSDIIGLNEMPELLENVNEYTNYERTS